MMNLEKLREHRDVVTEIDWTMTPEKAIDMYLEWGAGWTRGHEFIRSGDEESIYFVIYDWEHPAVATLLRRSSRDVAEIAKIAIPEELAREAVQEAGYRPGVGVCALSHALKVWLSEALNGPPVGPVQ
jgi:hypothetical protein